MMKQEWWKETVVYELYVQSFLDTNNDGIGDLNGVIQKLDYLKDLGIGAIWLTPIYLSPMVDNGYDVADYCQIDPVYGNFEVFQKLVKETKKREIKILMDLVLNHTSDQHSWFLEAKKSRDNPYRDFYIWKDNPDETKAGFGGSAWTYDEKTKQYYFHLFSAFQPDLNWSNPRVRAEIAKVINFWISWGVAGFRFDVIDLIGKEIENKKFTNGAMLHPYIQELRKTSWNDDCFLTVGECWSANLDANIKYCHQDSKELSMIFQFEHIYKLESELGKYQVKPIDFLKYKKIFQNKQNKLFGQAWNSLFLGNHDLPRAVSKYGNDHKYRIVSAKTLFATMFLMQGTPFIFQGEEIGMTNVNWSSIDQYLDFEVKKNYQDLVIKEKKLSHEEYLAGVKLNGRDNARTPYQWNEQIQAGFSQVKPWIPVNDNYLIINSQKDLKNEKGIYYFLQKILRMRKDDQYHDLIQKGTYEPLLLEHKDIFAYLRETKEQKLFVWANWSDKQIKIPEMVMNFQNLVLNTYSDYQMATLFPWQTLVFAYSK